VIRGLAAVEGRGAAGWGWPPSGLLSCSVPSTMENPLGVSMTLMTKELRLARKCLSLFIDINLSAGEGFKQWLMQAFNCGLVFIMEGVQEQQDLDMMAASTGEEYFNLKARLYCKQAVGNVFDMSFLECVKRTTFLASNYFTRILDMEREMEMEG
jgi:hypothetical protein